MNRTWAGIQYTTSITSSDKEGWTALDLLATADEKSQRAARIVFWDAAGQFFVEVFAKDLPLTVLEELIQEAKRDIRVR